PRGGRAAASIPQGAEAGEVIRGPFFARVGGVSPTRLLDARLHLLPSASRPLAQRARVRLHHGTAEIMARVLILADDGTAPEGSAATKQDRSGAQIEPGASRLVQLRLEKPVTALPGDRFIIRSYS